MKAYLAQIRMNLVLTLRDRSVLFFSYLFPLGFLFAFGEIGHAAQGGAAGIVNMVLTIGVLGSGFFGAALRAISDRERNILRRFKVAPIDAGPILVSSIVVGVVTYLPLVALVLALAIGKWHMGVPANTGSLLAFLGIGIVAFRAMGGIIASVANSMQEGQVLVQLLYTPMLLLGGATIPLTIMPQWLQVFAQFLPSTHFSTGLAGILLRNETLADNLPAAGALLLTAVVATFLGVKLFRWDKDEKLKPGAKAWTLAVLAPFIGMGMWQAHAKTNIEKEKILARELNRNRAVLLRDVRLFVGNGEVLDDASVLMRNGKIAQVFNGSATEVKDSDAAIIDGAGKTLMPGLIDARVHLDAPGITSPTQPMPDMARELATQLYCGVTTVGNVGAVTDALRQAGASINSGEALGAELFLDAPHEQADPSLAMLEVFGSFGKGDTSLLDRPLVRQVTPKEAIEFSKGILKQPPQAGAHAPAAPGGPKRLLAAYQNGETLVAGSDAGAVMLAHGPALHRELQLWVAAGIPPAVALQAATFNAAKALHAAERIGLVKEGYDANLLLMDGNPLQDISATERISGVFFRGEGVNRSSELLKQK